MLTRALAGSVAFILFTALGACSASDAPSPGENQAPAGGSTPAGGAATAGSSGSTAGGQGPASGGSSAGQGGSGGVATGGSGGSGVGGDAPLGGFGGAPEDKLGTVEVGIRNNCPFPLWIHGEGSGGVLMPDDQKLEHGDIAWYDAPEAWNAARITAYSDGPRQNEIEKAEMTFVPGEGGPVLNYNITYVDFVGLPIEIESEGGGASCTKVGCYVAQDEIQSGCPDDLFDGKKCVAARTYCLNPEHHETEFCNRMNEQIALCASTIAECAGAAGASTSDLYACATGTFFAGSPKWCAALNRGMMHDPDSTDLSAYYQAAPYNTYAKWVHSVCPGIYAFPYDDYPSNVDESGFRACNQGKELRITFCPAG